MSLYARFRPNKKYHLYDFPIVLKEGHELYAHFRPNKKDHLYDYPIVFKEGHGLSAHEHPILFHCSRFNNPGIANKMQHYSANIAHML